MTDLSPQSGPMRTLIRSLPPIAILWVHALNYRRRLPCFLLAAQMVVWPPSVVAAMIVHSSSGSIRKVPSMISVTRAGVLLIVVSTV
jgi:hypothetical protein